MNKTRSDSCNKLYFLAKTACFIKNKKAFIRKKKHKKDQKCLVYFIISLNGYIT